MQECMTNEDIACIREMEDSLQDIASQMWNLAHLVTNPRGEAVLKRHGSDDLCELIASMTLASHDLVSEAKPWLAFKYDDIHKSRHLPPLPSDVNAHQFQDDYQYAKAVTKHIAQIKNAVDEVIVLMKSDRCLLCVERNQKLCSNDDVARLIDSIRWTYDLAKSVRETVAETMKTPQDKRD